MTLDTNLAETTFKRSRAGVHSLNDGLDFRLDCGRGRYNGLRFDNRSVFDHGRNDSALNSLCLE